MATVEVLETNQTVEISETSQTVNVQSGVPDATSLNGNPVSAGSPSSGDVLRYDGSGWSVKAEADLDPTSLDASNLTAGSIADARVPESAVTQHEPFNADQLQGQNLPTSPSDGELLRYNGTSGEWEHARPEFPAEAFGADPSNADNRSEIQAAIDAAGTAGGGVVTIREPGVYVGTLSGGRVVELDTAGVDVVLGQGVTLKLADGELGGSDGHIVKVTASDCRVLGPGTIDGNRANNTPNGSLGQDAVRVEGAVSNVTVRGVVGINCHGHVVGLKGTGNNDRANDIHIVNNECDNCGEGIIFSNVNNIYVQDNYLHNIDKQDGIEPISADNVWITGNRIHDVDSSNGSIDAFDNLDRLIIGWNHCSGTGASIGVGGGTLGSISDVHVVGNTVEGGSTPPIQTFAAASSNIDGLVARDNLLNSSGEATFNSVDRLRVCGNRILGPATKVKGGSHEALIEGNIIENRLDVRSDRARIASNTMKEGRIEVSGNDCFVAYNHVQGDNTTGPGLQIEGDSTIVIGNNTSEWSGSSLYVTGTSSNTLIALNILVGGAVGGDSGATGVRFFGNEINNFLGFSVPASEVKGAAHNFGNRGPNESQGTATVSNGNTSVTVTHNIEVGTSRWPSGFIAAEDVSVTPTNDLGNASQFWVSNVGDDNFTINVDSDPGADTATFAWQVNSQ